VCDPFCLSLNPPPKRGRLSPRREGLKSLIYYWLPPSLLGEGGKGDEATKKTQRTTENNQKYFS